VALTNVSEDDDQVDDFARRRRKLTGTTRAEEFVPFGKEADPVPQGAA
jgi:hypothetical protein